MEPIKDEVVVVRGEPFELTERESQALQWLWDWQRWNRQSNYIFTDKPKGGR